MERRIVQVLNSSQCMYLPIMFIRLRCRIPIVPLYTLEKKYIRFGNDTFAHRLLHYPCSQNEDSQVWTLEANGSFTVKSCFKHFPRIEASYPWKDLWRCKAPSNMLSLYGQHSKAIFWLWIIFKDGAYLPLICATCVTR